VVLIFFLYPRHLLKERNIKISMDGKGRALDNQRIERFFRSYKWEKLYLEEYETGQQLKQITREYMEYYNNVRPHTFTRSHPHFQLFLHHFDKFLIHIFLSLAFEM
jgi:hypothetical protein